MSLGSWGWNTFPYKMQPVWFTPKAVVWQVQRTKTSIWFLPEQRKIHLYDVNPPFNGQCVKIHFSCLKRERPTLRCELNSKQLTWSSIKTRPLDKSAFVSKPQDMPCAELASSAWIAQCLGFKMSPQSLQKLLWLCRSLQSSLHDWIPIPCPYCLQTQVSLAVRPGGELWASLHNPGMGNITKF